MGVINLLLLESLFAFSISALIWCFAIAVYNLYLSPIAHFPGPKIAAISFWYEFYYDVILGGQYMFRVRELHDKYGPVVRINPRELHFIDPSFLDEIYAGGGRKRDKWEWYTRQVGLPTATLTTVPHDLHRIRRAALNPFFSKGSVRNLQPVIDEKIMQLLQRFEAGKNSEEVFTLNHVFAAFGNDVVTEYAFARCNERLLKDDFDIAFHDNIIGGSTGGHLMKHWNWILRTLKSLPESISTKLVPAYRMFVTEKKGATNLVMKVIVDSDGEESSFKHRTIFHELLNSKLPPQEKSLDRLADDAMITVAAGTITTAYTLCVATFHILSKPQVLRALKDELKSAVPDAPFSLTEVESLPYLAACIEESLRLSYGSTARLPRAAPDEVLTYHDGDKSWQIPKGTPLSTSSYLFHHEESVFPDSYSFRPERWIEDPKRKSNQLSFSRGSRQCVGINLAYAELFLLLARIFKRYGSPGYRDPDDKGILQLVETTERDVVCVADFNIAGMWSGTKGVRICVKT